MKFSDSLAFNSVPEWRDKYLDYDALKSLIYKYEKASLYKDAPEDLESSALLAQPYDHSAANKEFEKLLDLQLEKVSQFYAEKEKELLSEVQMLDEQIIAFEERLRREEEAEDREAEDDSDVDDDDDDRLRGSLYVSDPVGETLKPILRRKKSGSVSKKGRKLSISNTKPLVHEIFNVSEENLPPTPPKQPEPNLIDTTYSNSEPLTSTSSQATLIPFSSDSPAHTLASQFATHPPSTLHHFPASSPMPSRPLGPSPSMRQHKLSNGTRPRSKSLKGRATSGDRERSRRLSLDADDDGLTRESLWSEGLSEWATDAKIMFRRQLTELFTNLSELSHYSSLNYTGFSKILKKFDKVTFSSLRSKYINEKLNNAFPFEPTTKERLSQGTEHVVKVYARLVGRGDLDEARRRLKAAVREHVVWERNTIWREMIGLSRSGWASRTIEKPLPSSLTEPEKPTVIQTPIGKFELPVWLGSKPVTILIALLVFTGICNSDWLDSQEKRNCAGMLVFATILWATEAIPLFVTGLIIPFLVVVLRVMRGPEGNRLSAVEGGKAIFSQMFSTTIMLLIGGFTIAAALSKENIDKVLARKLLSLAGTRPSMVLLSYMFFACFASMLISNVAAPVLCFSLIQPILRTLPSTSNFPKSLILGIALSSNVGGQTSPISSPQNLIAIEYMTPPLSWGEWFAISIPVCVVGILLIWLILLYSFGSSPSDRIQPVRSSKDPFVWSQIYVSLVTIGTIVLWCLQSKIDAYLGEMGVIAIIPLVAFYGTGILRKQDWDNLAWSVVFLAMGGISLGKAVLSSGLLDDIDQVVKKAVEGLDIFTILITFSVLVLIISTFVSHTIAAVLLVPIAAQIGNSLKEPHPRLLIMSTALICSAGMGLPVSGYPNMAAINLENDIGGRYLAVGDFLRNGIPASIVSTAVVVSVGYGIMRVLGL